MSTGTYTYEKRPAQETYTRDQHTQKETYTHENRPAQNNMSTGNTSQQKNVYHKMYMSKIHIYPLFGKDFNREYLWTYIYEKNMST